MITIKILMGSFFEAENAEQETNKVDDDENNERVVVQMRFNDGPKGILNKVDKPVGAVTKSGTSSQGMEWQQFSNHQPWHNTTSKRIGEEEENGRKDD
jgi:hypothetical protein